MNIPSNQSEEGKKRIEELDFLKALFILLMITFHLAYIGDGYPYLKRFVYTFHMPGFLIISGYLSKVGKPIKSYCQTVLWLAVPYIIMEMGYVAMASLLPIKDHIPTLSIEVMLNKLCLRPLGPYWYLHTLIICGTLYFSVFRWVKASAFSRLIILGIAYYVLSLSGIISFTCAMYFLVGVLVRQSSLSFLTIFRRSWWSLVVLAILYFYPSAFNRATVGGTMIVYFVFSFLLTVFPYVPIKSKEILLFLGRNSLILYIFSPIFTLCCKVFIPYLSFDSTRLLFLCISLPICVIGSLGICKVLDLLHLSPFLFGRKHALPSFNSSKEQVYNK